MCLDVFICPCDNTSEFKTCCGKIHNDISFAKTALDLMRSRYSGFVLANINFLISSHAVETRNEFNPTETERWTKSVQWKNLEIISTINGQPDDHDGKVEFKAYYFEKGKLKFIHGKSRFIRDLNNHWMYLDEF